MYPPEKKYLKISLELIPAPGLESFRQTNGTRRIGMVYFQKIADGGLVARTISQATDADWLDRQIRLGNILITEERIIAEPT